MKGVVNSDKLIDHLRSLKLGSYESRSYVVGSLKYLTVHPPNKYIVPLLRHALEAF